MANLFDQRNPEPQETEFNPVADNRAKGPKYGTAVKVIWYLSFLLIFPLIFHLVKRNSFFKMQNAINEASSGIDVQLAKRADTLTKLVDQVRSYKVHEASVFEDVAKYRNLVNAGNGVAHAEEIQKMNDSIFGRLMAVYENYPELKADKLYKELMDQTTYIERELAAARRLYNGKVNSFNTEIFMIPSSIVASTMGLVTAPLYRASSKQREDVSMANL